jgi:hypothetical protein
LSFATAVLNVLCTRCMSYKGIVKNGFVVLEQDAKLPEGTAVRVEPVTTVQQPIESVSEDDPLLRMLKLAGPTGIPDLSVNADHYLYGHPRVSDAR